MIASPHARLAALAVATALLGPGVVRAEEAEATVLVLVADGSGATVEALGVELASRGLRALPAAPPAGEEPAARARAAREAVLAAGARAAVWLEPGPTVWVSGPGEGELRFAPMPAGAPAARLVAVIAGSLLDELASPDGPPRTAVEPPVEAPVDGRAPDGAPAEAEALGGAGSPAEGETRGGGGSPGAARDGAGSTGEAPLGRTEPAGPFAARDERRARPASAPPGAAPLRRSWVAVDVVPYLGSSLVYRGGDLRYLSVGILAGWGGELRGLEVAGGAGIERRGVTGVQLAGGANAAVGPLVGLQVAGVLNLATGPALGLQLLGLDVAMDELRGGQVGAAAFVGSALVGLQLSGTVAIAGPARGVQLAVLAAAARGELVGLQASGLVDVAGPVRGAQLAPVLNVAGGEVQGAQLAFLLNVAREVRGLQAGLVNVSTGPVQGVQLGLFNYGRRAEVPIGLLSVVPGGRLHGELWGTESAFLHVALHHGGARTHNVFSFGKYLLDAETWSAGVGLGGRIPLAPWLDLDVDALVDLITRGDGRAAAGAWGLGALSARLRVVLGYHPVRWLALRLGLAYSLLFGFDDDGARYPLFGESTFWQGSFVVRGFPGFTVGVQVP